MLSRSINAFFFVGLNGWTAGASLEERRPTARGPMSYLGHALPARRASKGVSFVREAHDVRIGPCGGASGGDCPNGRKPGPKARGRSSARTAGPEVVGQDFRITFANRVLPTINEA